MSGYCPTGCVCRSAAGSANPRVVPDATATAQHDTPIPVAVQECQPVQPRRVMRIGIDLDGVCYDFAGSLRRYLVEHQGWSADACPAATRWEFYEDWGLTLKDFLALTAKGVDAGVIFTQGEPFRGTRAALERLKRAGHTLHVITDRSQGKPGVAQAATVEWLHRYQLPYDSITFSRDKTIVQTDAMIDDKLENYDALYRAGCHAYLYDRPWNQTTVWCRRVKNLARFAEVLT